ncbi:LCP family protein [Candidatus Saccharibacteria bacterium]|nr:LCP family protein [Candidatus Saccharibacteria bacterium]
MEKNKSIDGLVSRRSKKTTTSAKAKSPTKQSVTKPKPAKQTSSAPKKVQTKKPAKKPPKSPVVSPEPIAPVGNTAEDFLQPVKAFDFDEETGDLKASKKASKQNKPKKEKKKAGKVRKTLSIIALLLVLALIGGVTWVILWGNDIIAKITGGQGNVLDLIFTSETYEPLKTGANGRTNILAFGTSGYNMDGEVGNGVHAGAALTDSIMAISLDQETGDIAMVSLPRDLKASPTCTATGKINEVYWCNNMYGDNEQAGAEALMAEVGNVLGIDFQYYAHINWASLIEIVNILDRIKITLDEDILDYYGTGYNYYANTEYEIDGEQALILSRARYGTMGGDFTRSANQQKILIGIKNRVMEKNFSIADYLSLASALGDNLRTNFSIDELKSLAHLSFDFDFDSMRQISLLEPDRLMTTGTINGISYVLPVAGVGNYGDIQALVAKKMSSDPRVYEEPSILILNGTEEAGVAATEKSTLEKDGYLNIDIDDAPEGEYQDNYAIYATNNSKPGTKALLEQHYNASTKPLEELPENISREYDFIIILGGQTSE